MLSRHRNANFLAASVALASAATGWAENTNNIMLTGYWPPTNEIVRPFSTNPEQNPTWIGGNWHDRGYNIYSYFPEFPGGTETNPEGVGDFQVDYQDTLADWQRITGELKPVAIITLSWAPGRGEYGLKDWELEARNKNRNSWTDDYEAPFDPTPNPPDDTVPANWTRSSSLPMQSITDAVNTANVGVNAYIDNFSSDYGGTFLSEYIGYLNVWYHYQHLFSTDPAQSVANGHIHVGSGVTVEEGRAALDVTLDSLIDYIDSVVPEPSSLTLFTVLAAAATLRRRRG